MERRRDEWRREIADGLRKLESDTLRLEDLTENEEFIDTVLHASHAAIGNSQGEKREALRNAVLNSALGYAPDATQQLVFIQFVDTFTVVHLRLLLLLDDPSTWFVNHKQELPKGPPKTLWPVVMTAFPDLANLEVLCERVCTELHEKGLLIASSLRKDVARFPFFPKQPREQQTGYRFVDELPNDGTVAYSGSPTSLRHWTTELGRQFLAFIASPIDD